MKQSELLKIIDPLVISYFKNEITNSDYINKLDLIAKNNNFKISRIRTTALNKYNFYNEKHKDIITSLRQEKSEQAIKALKYKKLHIDYRDRTSLSFLMIASKYGSYDVVLEILKKGADVNLKTKGGSNALFFVFNREPKKERENQSILKLLLEYNIEENIIDNNGLDIHQYIKNEAKNKSLGLYYEALKQRYKILNNTTLNKISNKKIL